MSACITGRRLLYTFTNQDAEEQPPAMKLNEPRVTETVSFDLFFSKSSMIDLFRIQIGLYVAVCQLGTKQD